MHALYPHSRGLTRLDYSQCGRYVFTAGENMLIRRFLANSTEGSQSDQQSIDLENKTGRCVRTTPNNELIVGCDSGDVVMFYTETCDLKRSLFRTALAIYHLDVSKDGKWCAVTGEDSCKLVSLADEDVQRKLPVNDARTATFSPVNSEVLAVSQLDGRIIVVENGSMIAEIDGLLPNITDFFESKTSTAIWSPDGSCIACPTKTYEIALVRVSDQLVHKRLDTGNVSNSLAFCPGGRFLVCCTKDEVIVFDVKTGDRANSFKIQDGLDARWHPTENLLSVTTEKGQLFNLPEPVPESLGPVNAQFNVFEEELVEEEDLFVNSEPDLPSDDAQRSPRRRTLEFDIDELAARYDQRNYSNPDNYLRPSKRPKLGFSKQSSVQKPFQTGSTPFEGQKRYLCMSDVGYIWTLRQSDSHNTITTNFFDQSIHRETHFQDSDLFDLAQLSPEASVFANSKRAFVSVRFHANLTSNWNLQLDPDLVGGINCVTLSSDVVCVFTQRGGMRVFGLYGAPIGVSNAHSVICCAAYQNDVFYVHQSEGGTYTYTFEGLAGNTFYQKNDSLDLPPGTEIKALFFSSEGEPCFMDSFGVLYTAVHARMAQQCKFVQVFSNPLGKESQTTYWPLGVSENKLLCVLVPGQREYPAFPLPITDEVDFKVPGLEGPESDYILLRTACVQLEDQILRLKEGEVDTAELEEKFASMTMQMDVALLKQYQQACEGQRISKAAQLVQLIQNEESMRAAAQVASALNYTSLAQQIAEALE